MCHRAIRDGNAAEKSKKAYDRIVARDTEYYIGGPQQAKPADGNLKKGTRVRLVREAGSYSLIETENGIVAYVATTSLQRIDKAKE